MRVALGLSGGVDSSVAALLLKEAGHEVCGVTMRLWRPGLTAVSGGCFGPQEEETVAAARQVAGQVGIDFRVFDVSERFGTEVIRYFSETYLAGGTPNPCVRCNERVKFGLLPQLAREAGFGCFATGHYARIRQEAGGRAVLMRGKDCAKDQSYFLYRVRQEQLQRTIFPLGGMTKDEVRARARAAGFASAEKKDSQDFYSGDRAALVGKGDAPGDIVTQEGRVIGRHAGCWHYTIGQRKGLGVGGGVPYYVTAVDVGRNRVTVGRQADVRRTSFSIADCVGAFAGTCRVKIRSTGEPLGPAYVTGNRVEVPGGVMGVAAGQSAVFYDAEGDDVLGGGIIQS